MPNCWQTDLPAAGGVTFRRRRGTIHPGTIPASNPEPPPLPPRRAGAAAGQAQREVLSVRSTMMDVQLTVTALMRHGISAYGDREVVTCTADGSRRQTYAQTGARAARLANALCGLGVDADQRVGTLMWNNAEHLEAYLAVPSMGAVLHTLNLRLDPEVIGYIATHAGDDVVIVDATLVPLIAQVLPHAPAIRHILVTGKEAETDDSALAGLGGHGPEVHSYEDLLAAQPASFDWPDLDERLAAAMCYTSGTTGRPKA